MFFIVFYLGCTEIRKEKLSSGAAELLSEIEGVTVNTGSFTMGSNDHSFDEGPEHKVNITYPFEMMKTEVTQKEYRFVMGENPSFFTNCGENCPVEKVRWIDTIHFANKLNGLLGLEACYVVEDKKYVTWSKGFDCEGWRLPTEAEWEYTVQKVVHDRDLNVNKISWYNDNSEGHTHPVCLKDELMGFCDLLGNVQEWVWDRPEDYPKDELTDPMGGETSSHRSFRGGAWNRYPHNINWKIRKEANILFRNNDLGFRLVRTVTEDR